MPTAPLRTIADRLRGAACLTEAAQLPDGQLLERYAHGGDEVAFEALLRRHGPMVLGVCRRLLSNSADAEDAFQATFLVLVKKAKSVVPGERVGNFLYGVAYRAAQKAREAARRRSRAKQMRDVEDQAAAQGECDE